jgi:SNF2 family DNA or RNA helicase
VGQLDPHQYAFVRYALWRKRVLNADQMGCGKTIESLAAVQAASAFPCVIVSPAAMKLVWRDELRTWLPGRSVQVVSSDNQPARGYDFTVLNYEILDRHLEFLQGLGPRSLIIDEAHAVKEETSKRTAAVRALAKGSLLHAPPEHIFLLTGTPVLNRPMELMSPLDILGWLDHFGGSWDYRMRYCSPSRTKSGIVFQGASNLPELHEKLLETCFIRRKKADVLKHLPPKSREVLPVRLTNPEEYARAHAGIVDWLQQEGRKTYVQGLARIEVCRQVAAKGKLAYTRDWIDNFLETGDKLVVFAHHVAMQDALLRLFPGSATVRAGQGEGERYNNIRRFQQDETCQLMVASLGAGSVGVTLNASAHVLMTQLGWTPAIHDQAEDRCHRRGQLRPVTATYLIGEKTVEEKLWEILEKKRIIVNTIHDGKDVDEQSVVKELMDSLAAEA